MNRKFVILVGDGMGDYPLEELGGKTPLEAARTPNMDELASRGRIGLVQTIPGSMEPGSDVANMSLLGYDPARYHTGRGPLEAASMGVKLHPMDVAFRCNLVCLDVDSSGITRMGDYSAGHISTPESHRIVSSLQKAVAGTPLRLYSGVSYRHLVVWPEGPTNLQTTPPHDISGEPVSDYMKTYLLEPVLAGFMERASAILADHDVNRERTAAGKRVANAVWLWGQGRAPSMPTMKERFGLKGVMISAVDLLKGLGVYAGLEVINVPGATGYLDTNYSGKVAAALKALKEGQFAYLHVEAPDEAGHEGSLSKKIEAIESFDERVVGPILEGLKSFDRASLLLVMDHFTPISKKTHVSDAVPFVLAVDVNGRKESGGASSPGYSERAGKAAGWLLSNGVELFNLLVGAA